MKKLTTEQKIRFNIRSRKLNERRLVSVEKKRKFSRAKYKHITNKFGKTNTTVKISLPENMSLQDNYEEVIEFFDTFRYETSLENNIVYVDFTTVKKVHSCAAIMLAGELDRWSRLKRIQLRVKKIHKWDPTVKRLLMEMGLFELLSVFNPPIAVAGSNPDPVYLHFKTDSLTMGESAKELRKELEAVAERNIPEKRFLFDGITEAMANVSHHAYPDEGNYLFEPIMGQWWMSGSVNRQKECITVIFYDQGVGIPETLPASYTVERILEFIENLGLRDNDASRIKAAMNLGRTSTAKEHRGYGLLNIRSFIANSERGILRILSGRGEYIFNADGSDKLISHRRPLGGTLIQWIVYL